MSAEKPNTEEMQIAVYGVDLSDSESAALRDVFAEEAAKGGGELSSLLESMLAHDLDEGEPGATGPHYNEGYSHAVGVEMGASGYADVAKLIGKPPSKYQKKFDSEVGAQLAKIGVKRRARAILVTQQRKA